MTALAEGRPGVLTCSSLKEVYRNRLLKGGEGLGLVYLRGDYDLFWERMSSRRGHYMEPQMLRRQFAALEERWRRWSSMPLCLWTRSWTPLLKGTRRGGRPRIIRSTPRDALRARDRLPASARRGPPTVAGVRASPRTRERTAGCTQVARTSMYMLGKNHYTSCAPGRARGTRRSGMCPGHRGYRGRRERRASPRKPPTTRQVRIVVRRTHRPSGSVAPDHGRRDQTLVLGRAAHLPVDQSILANCPKRDCRRASTSSHTLPASASLMQPSWSSKRSAWGL